MLNYAKRRSLSGQRAFAQVGEHAPDRKAEIGTDSSGVVFMNLMEHF